MPRNRYNRLIIIWIIFHFPRTSNLQQPIIIIEPFKIITASTRISRFIFRFIIVNRFTANLSIYIFWMYSRSDLPFYILYSVIKGQRFGVVYQHFWTDVIVNKEYLRQFWNNIVKQFICVIFILYCDLVNIKPLSTT